DFPPGVDEAAALRKILDDAWDRDLRYLTNQDLAVHPRADQWANGTDMAAELDRMMEIRRVALSRFGENAIRRGAPMATLEEVLVPLYLHHRYQVEATASVLGGIDYIYAFRGDGRIPMRRVGGTEQRNALRALAATIRPAELVLPRKVLELIPPRPSGYGMHRELFPRYTGMAFDVISPAVVAARHTISNMLAPDRAARLVQQHALDPSLPGLEEVLDTLHAATFGAAANDAYAAEVRRATERVLVEELMRLAERATMPQVRAIATHRLERSVNGGLKASDAAEADAAHHALLVADVRRFLDRPASPYTPLAVPEIPPGAPIGEPALDWIGADGLDTWLATPSSSAALDRFLGIGPACSWDEGGR